VTRIANSTWDKIFSVSVGPCAWNQTQSRAWALKHRKSQASSKLCKCWWPCCFVHLPKSWFQCSSSSKWPTMTSFLASAGSSSSSDSFAVQCSTFGSPKRLKLQTTLWNISLWTLRNSRGSDGLTYAVAYRLDQSSSLRSQTFLICASWIQCWTFWLITLRLALLVSSVLIS